MSAQQTPTGVAVDMIELGADALTAAAPGLRRHQAVTTAAVVLAAVFPELAALVAEQAYARAQDSHLSGGNPVSAVGMYAIELRMQAQDPST